MTKEREALIKAHAFIRWVVFGECRTDGHDGPPPTAAWVNAAIEEALAQPSDSVEPTPEQQEQEPVVWLFQHDETGRTMCVDEQQIKWGFEKENSRWKKISPLYTTPPKREWIGLTDDERKQIRFNFDGMESIQLKTEAKLKELNHD